MLPPIRGAFAPGVPDLKQFPFKLWQRYLDRYVRNPKLQWQTNSNQGGSIELRKMLTDYLRIVRGIRCEPAQILITYGTQHSLQLIANLLADIHDRVWLENPGYQGARCIFDAAGLVTISQPVDNEGISPTLDAWRQPPRITYTTPSHLFPTGVVMSMARRRHLLSLASQHKTWVIEDDYDHEFHYGSSPLPALHALAPQQVIYLGTLSKTFYPSVHIGYMVLPEELVSAFCSTQVRHHREPSYAMHVPTATALWFVL